MSEKGRQLDLTSDVETQRLGQSNAKSQFLGVHFACCDVYARIYANRDQSAYVGRCPRCTKQIRFQIGTGGTDSRFFTAY